MIDLREKDKTAIQEIANRIFEPKTELWVYGSRVKGTNTPSSDLDLLIIFPESQHPNETQPRILPQDPHNNNYDKLTEFKGALTDSTIPIFVDVFDWQLIPDTFKQNILDTKELLFRIT